MSRLFKMPVQVLATSFIAAVGLSGAALAQTATQTGPYLSLGAGVNMPEHQRLYAPGSSPAVTDSFSFDTGFEGVGAFGYKWNSGLRTELEVDYRHADVDTANGVDAQGSQRTWGAMANVLYDFPVSWRVQPYIGGGIGIGTDRWHNVSGGALAGFPAPTFTSQDTAQFQWQGIAGLNFALSPQTALFADYRYIDLDNRHFNADPIGSFRSGRDQKSSSVLLGIRYFFHS